MQYFYDESTDTYWETNTHPSEEIIADYPIGTISISQRPSHLHTYLDGGWAPPSVEVLNESIAEEVRYERDSLLAREVDKVVTNPLRWADLSAEKQAEWIQYRRDLLDITDQEGFPTSITWPTIPQ